MEMKMVIIWFIIIVVVGVYWIKQFAFLMSLSEKELNGPYDKLVWGVAFVLLPMAAPFAFIVWRNAKMRSW